MQWKHFWTASSHHVLQEYTVIYKGLFLFFFFFYKHNKKSTIELRDKKESRTWVLKDCHVCTDWTNYKGYLWCVLALIAFHGVVMASLCSRSWGEATATIIEWRAPLSPSKQDIVLREKSTTRYILLLRVGLFSSCISIIFHMLRQIFLYLMCT